jgi:hypothetical protein
MLPALTETGEVSCPGLHTKEFLMDQKDTIDERAWLKEYMLNPMAVNENVIDDDIIARCLNDKDTYYIDYIPKPNEVMILGVDFAIIDNKFEAEKKNSAYFTLVPCAYNLLTNERLPKDLFYER